MKKHFLFPILFIFVTSLAWSVSSVVHDDCGLLSNHEIQELEARAQETAQTYNCGVYIYIVKDMDSYTFDYEIYSDAYRVEAFAQYIFFNELKGMGSTGDGILLVMSMKERDFDIMAHGDFGNYAFTDYGKNHLADSFLDYFGDNEWYKGFSTYLNRVERYMKAAAEGNPVDNGSPRLKEHNIPISIAAGLIFGMIVALISCLSMKSGMKSVRIARIASNFIAEDGVNIPIQKDMSTHNTVVRTPLQTSSSSGGGGGTHINSSGSSHHSGKF